MDALKELFSICSSLNTYQQKVLKTKLSSRSKKSYPFKIFERLCKLKKYDQEKLKAGIPNFTLHFHYLKTNIEQNLHLLEEDIETKVRNKISAANFLYLNGSYKWADKIIAETKKIAQDHFMYLQLLQLNNLEMNLSMTKHASSYYNEKVYLEKDEYLQKFNFEIKYTCLAAELFKIAHTKDHFKDKRKKANELAKKNRIPKNEIALLEPALSMRYAYFEMLVQYAQYNIEEFSILAKQMFELFQKNKKLQTANKVEFLRTIVNYSGGLFASKNYEEIPKMKALIDNFPYKAKRFQLYTFEYFDNIYISYLMATIDQQDKQMVLKYIEDCADFLDANDDAINQVSKKVLMFNISSLYFTLKMFPESRTWINRYFHQFKRKSDLFRDFYYHNAEVLNLLLNFEQENFSILKKEAKSYLKKTTTAGKEKYKIESAVINFFINTPFNKLSTNELIETISNLRKEIIAFSMNSEDERKFNERYFNFIDWFETKIEDLKNL